MIDLKRYDDVMHKAKCISTGEVIKKANGKWSFRMELNILPTDDVLKADGPEFDSAIEAAQAMYKVYGAESWEG